MKLLLKLSFLAATLYLLSACTVTDTFVVTTTNDTVDANVGDKICADANGDCSLRAATQEGNANAGLTTIQLTGGETYTLSILGIPEGDSASGDLNLRAPTTITTDTGQATISSAVTFLESAIRADHDAGTTTLANLNISGFDNAGGTVITLGTTEALVIENTRIHDNTHGLANLSSGLVDIRNSTIDNTTVGTPVFTQAGPVNLYQATIADNNNVGMQIAGDATVDIESSTITSTLNGAFFFFGSAANTTITTSVIDTFGPNCAATGGTTPPATGGDNLFSDVTCGINGSGDVVNSTGNLKPLFDNGGPIPTQMPTYLRDAWKSYPCPAGVGPDARGVARSGTSCDKGAVESQPNEATGADCLPTPNIVAGADLALCDLSSAQGFSQRDLSGTIFVGANLTGFNLRENNLTGADFFGANLTDTALIFADMTDVSADGANFTDSLMIGSTTTNATFNNALWSNTTCPDNTNSDSSSNGGTCEGHLNP